MILRKKKKQIFFMLLEATRHLSSRKCYAIYELILFLKLSQSALSYPTFYLH